MISAIAPCKLGREAEVPVASGRKIKDESEARRCLRAANLAGRGAGEWARAHGIDGRSLNSWKVNLARRGTSAAPRRRKPEAPRRRKPEAPRPTHALVELVPVGSSAKLAAGGRYVIEFAGARVVFDDHCSVATLRRVLEALRSC